MSTPPFRAEHVGSLLRPATLLSARAAAEGDQYRQVSGPLKFPTSGSSKTPPSSTSWRCRKASASRSSPTANSAAARGSRTSCSRCPGRAFSGSTAGKTISAALPFQTDTTVEKLPGHLVRVTGKLKRVKPIFTEHFAFLKKQTTRTPKISIPSPSMLHFWGGRAAIDETVYPDIDEFWNDAVIAWTAEIAELAALGCTYIQIDDVTFPLICDPHGQDALTARGDDPHKIIETYASVLNRIVAGTPKGVTLGMHMCRGNNRGQVDGQRRRRIRQRGRAAERRHPELLHGGRHRPRRRFPAAAARAERQARDPGP